MKMSKLLQFARQRVVTLYSAGITRTKIAKPRHFNKSADKCIHSNTYCRYQQTLEF